MEIKTTKEIELEKYEYSICQGNQGLKWDKRKKEEYENKKWVPLKDLEKQIKLLKKELKNDTDRF